MPPRFIARQLAQPTGVLGRVIARMMNRHNASMNAFALTLLELMPDDRVLEVGFGGGLMLPFIMASAGHVIGLDRSAAMVQRAQAKFAEAVSAGRAEFREGRVEALPFGPATFGKACTINTIYFWPSLPAGFAELHRVLVPGGRLVVGFLPKEWMDQGGYPPDIFTSRTPDEVIGALTDAGFHMVRVERPQPTTRSLVIIATR
jgi:ubiquinone/menaquinone biosynthesis C-methylase UbiE